MNLEESDVFKEELEKKNRSQKGVLISIVFCGFLVVLLFILLRIVIYQDSVTAKLYLDDKQISIPDNFYIVKDDDIYFNLKQFGALLGYNYTKGVYGEYNENPDSGYLQNDFEILAVTAGANKFTKYIQIASGTKIDKMEIKSKNANNYSESFHIEKPVIYENDTLYVSKDYIPTMFNVQIGLEEYRTRIYSLNYMIEMAKNVVSKAGYFEMSGNYENLRAIASGFIVVGDSKDAKTASSNYGVINLKANTVISTKYEEITFVQNTEQFYVTTSDGRVGILDKEAGNVIAPSDKFEEISLLDQENKIYLVRKGKEYGVVNGTGKILIYPEKDRIGLDITKFASENIESNAILFNKCIPVEKDGKYGLYDLNGDVVLDCVYDGFGYVSPEKASSGNEESVLLIPSFVGINGIVVNYNDMYGIYDVNVGLTVPTVFEKIYSRTKNGEITYYVQYNGEEMNLADYLRTSNLNTVDEEGRLLSDLQATDQSQTNDSGTVVEEQPSGESTELPVEGETVETKADEATEVTE